MSDGISSVNKQELCKKMASNLSTLREKAKLTQDELAARLGLSRQNISAIENEKHEMTWSTFSILIMFFANDTETKQIMIALGIFNDEVCKVFNISN